MYIKIFDWLKYQEIGIPLFLNNFYNWIMQLTKRNSLIFQRAPNAGKNHFVQAIWQSFTIHTQLLPERLFTFANLINSDCAFLEEPLITPDNVVMNKLVLERQ